MKHTFNQRQTGEISVRSLISLILVFMLLHGLIKVAPLYIKYFYFREAVKDTARMAKEKGDDEILGLVLESAREIGLPVTEENVTLERAGDESFRVRVNFFVEVKFLWGFYRRFDFNCQAEAPLR